MEEGEVRGQGVVGVRVRTTFSSAGVACVYARWKGNGESFGGREVYVVVLLLRAQAHGCTTCNCKCARLWEYDDRAQAHEERGMRGCDDAAFFLFEGGGG